MAKHHVKNKKKKGSKEHKHSRPPIEENLDRFAGSSEDENNNENTSNNSKNKNNNNNNNYNNEQ